MSRTYHHRNQKGRHNGEDLWSRRHGGCLPYTAYSKWLTRKTEKSKKKKLIKLEFELEELR